MERIYKLASRNLFANWKHFISLVLGICPPSDLSQGHHLQAFPLTPGAPQAVDGQAQAEYGDRANQQERGNRLPQEQVSHQRNDGRDKHDFHDRPNDSPRIVTDTHRYHGQHDAHAGILRAQLHGDMDAEDIFRPYAKQLKQQIGYRDNGQEHGTLYQLKPLQVSRGMHGHEERIGERAEHASAQDEAQEVFRMLGNDAQPPPQDQRGLQHQRQRDEPQDEKGELGALYQQTVHPRQVSTGVTFGQLGIQGRLETIAEALGNGLYLYRDATGGIDHGAIKQVQ